jgi:hypothetical protein
VLLDQRVLKEYKGHKVKPDLLDHKVILVPQGQVETELHHQLTMETEPSHLPLTMELHLLLMI